MMIDIHRNM